MNGFSYAANRFSWAYAMLVAYIFVHTWEDLVKLTARQKKQLLLAGIVCAAVCMSFEEGEPRLRSVRWRCLGYCCFGSCLQELNG